jgi:hypothetical protein
MDTLPIKPPPAEKNLPDSRDCWALLERIVASSQFRRATRLRDFLCFVGRRSLKEGCDQIHEQEIGSEVFGRPVGYDTSTDNIVRVNASELRKRVESFFEEEGAQEPLILEIPRGSYRPVFRRRSNDVPDMEEVPDIAVPPAPRLRSSVQAALSALFRYPQIISVAIIVLLAIACGVQWQQISAMHRSLYAWESTPALHSFWSGILDARPETDVVLADTSFALIEDIAKKPISLNNYLNHDYINQLQSSDLSQDRRDDLELIAARNFGSLGDFRVAQRIVALDPLAKRVHLHYAREYPPVLVKQDSVILIGSRKSNPWVDLFEGSMNFTVRYDPNHFVSFVKNRAPAAGEQETYAPELASGYSVIAYLPNPGQSGKVLIIAGTGSEATESAGDFLTSEVQLAHFQKMLHVDKLPYFEILLKTTHLSDTPLDATVVAYRIYPGLR